MKQITNIITIGLSLNDGYQWNRLQRIRAACLVIIVINVIELIFRIAVIAQ